MPVLVAEFRPFKDNTSVVAWGEEMSANKLHVTILVTTTHSEGQPITM